MVYLPYPVWLWRRYCWHVVPFCIVFRETWRGRHVRWQIAEFFVEMKFGLAPEVWQLCYPMVFLTFGGKNQREESFLPKTRQNLWERKGSKRQLFRLDISSLIGDPFLSSSIWMLFSWYLYRYAQYVYYHMLFNVFAAYLVLRVRYISCLWIPRIFVFLDRWLSSVGIVFVCNLQCR